MSKQTLEFEIEKLNNEDRKRLNFLYEKANRTTPEIWYPEEGTTCWYIDIDGKPYEVTWKSLTDQQAAFDRGICFRSYVDAEFYSEKLKVKAELERFSFENNKEEIDWENAKQYKYYIGYKHGDFTEHLVYECVSGKGTQFSDTVYFTDKYVAEQATKKLGKKRIEKYLFGNSGFIIKKTEIKENNYGI